MNFDFDKTLDIAAKVVAIISTGLLIREKLKEKKLACKISIKYAQDELPLESDGAGGFENKLVPVIAVDALNTGGIEVYPADISLYVNGKWVNASIHNFWRYEYRSGIPMQNRDPLQPSRKYSGCYAGLDVEGLMPHEFRSKKSLAFQVVLRDEYGHRFTSNTIKVAPEKLLSYALDNAAYRQICDRYEHEVMTKPECDEIE